MTPPRRTADRTPKPKRPNIPDTGAITGFGAARGDIDSCVVKVDGRKAATIMERDRVDLGLRVDMPLTTRLSEQIADCHEYRLARRAAMQRIARKARSTKDIRDFLRKRAHTDPIVDQVIDKLKELKLLDDERFADDAATSIARRTPSSARFLEHRLRRHGVSPEDAAKAAKAAAGDPLEAAIMVATKALRSLQSCEPDIRRQRLHGRLARRGFDFDVIQQAIERVAGQMDT
ncbi:MAG: hypothetical protein CMJ40_00895 [Phycisphaerae bacterium]|nr:hypothetical protein [Phycisphaerae bacterium]